MGAAGGQDLLDFGAFNGFRLRPPRNDVACLRHGCLQVLGCGSVNEKAVADPFRIGKGRQHRVEAVNPICLLAPSRAFGVAAAPGRGDDPIIG